MEVHPPFSMPTLSIIVPIYNEAPHLAEVIDHLLTANCQIDRDWIFIDDCSTDGSREILEGLQQKHGFRLLKQDKNRGKGAAIKRGIDEAKGEIIMIQDADFEYDPRDMPSLIEPIIQNEADVVYGSRFKKSATQVHRTYHYFINRFLTFLSNLFSGLYLTDMETCYKVFDASLVKSMNLNSKRFGIEVELTAYVGKVRARVFELPIRYYPRTKLAGKKISWKDGVAALWHLIRYNFFTPIDRAFTDLPKRFRPGIALQPMHSKKVPQST